jgi:hypothetical protein
MDGRPAVRLSNPIFERDRTLVEGINRGGRVPPVVRIRQVATQLDRRRAASPGRCALAAWAAGRQVGERRSPGAPRALGPQPPGRHAQPARPPGCAHSLLPTTGQDMQERSSVPPSPAGRLGPGPPAVPLPSRALGFTMGSWSSQAPASESGMPGNEQPSRLADELDMLIKLAEKRGSGPGAGRASGNGPILFPVWSQPCWRLSPVPPA